MNLLPTDFYVGNLPTDPNQYVRSKSICNYKLYTCIRNDLISNIIVTLLHAVVSQSNGGFGNHERKRQLLILVV